MELSLMLGVWLPKLKHGGGFQDATSIEAGLIIVIHVDKFFHHFRQFCLGTWTLPGYMFYISICSPDCPIKWTTEFEQLASLVTIF